MNKRKNYEITEFGKFTRVLRAQNGEDQKDMAERLGINPSRLCSYETARAMVPISMYPLISKKYKLSKEQEELLKDKILKTNKKITEAKKLEKIIKSQENLSVLPVTEEMKMQSNNSDVLNKILEKLTNIENILSEKSRKKFF